MFLSSLSRKVHLPSKLRSRRVGSVQKDEALTFSIHPDFTVPIKTAGGSYWCDQRVRTDGDGVTQTDVEETQRTAVGVAVLKAWRDKSLFLFNKRYLFGSVKTNQSNLLYVLMTGINYRKPPEEFIPLLSGALDSNVLFFYTWTNLSHTKHAFILTVTDRVKTRRQNWN